MSFDPNRCYEWSTSSYKNSRTCFEWRWEGSTKHSPQFAFIPCTRADFQQYKDTWWFIILFSALGWILSLQISSEKDWGKKGHHSWFSWILRSNFVDFCIFWVSLYPNIFKQTLLIFSSILYCSWSLPFLICSSSCTELVYTLHIRKTTLCPARLCFYWVRKGYHWGLIFHWMDAFSYFAGSCWDLPQS